jgi:hypothetical protein
VTATPDYLDEAAVVPSRFPDTYRLLDDVELLELPDPEFEIDGFLPSRSVGVFYAPPGAGKTTLVAGVSVAQAARDEIFGHRVLRPGASIYVATEDVSGFKMRLTAAKRAARLPLDSPIGVYTFPEPIDLRDPVSVTTFRQFVSQVEFPIPLRTIYVDTYAGANPGASENSSEDTTTAMVHAQHWRDVLGVTVVLVHHTNAGGNRERGHSAMRGAADFMISLTPVDDVVHVECSKQRNAAPFEKLQLKLTAGPDGQGCVFHLADDILPSGGLTDAQVKVFEILRDTFAADGATKAEWQRTCQASVSERTFHRACKVLLERGYVKPHGSHFRVAREVS